MVRSLMFAVVIAASLGSAQAAASGAPPAHRCRDAQGHFIKCPPAKPVAQHCKDAKGKFVKCDAPGAIPVSSAPASSHP